MNAHVDVYVCEPEVGIDQQLETVFIEFEVMDRETQECTGTSHTVLMPMPDAMQLLRTLQHIQKRFSLPEGTVDPVMVEINLKKN